MDPWQYWYTSSERILAVSPNTRTESPVTLVQLLADERSIHMSCDFRLTDVNTGLTVQNDAHKLVHSMSPHHSAIIGVTGVAVLEAQPVGSWLAKLIGGSGAHVGIDELTDRLSDAATAELSGIPDPVFRRTSFVVGAIVGTQTIIMLVSNFERFVNGRLESSDTAADEFVSTRIRPKGPQLILTGAASAITQQERELAQRLLRTAAPDETIQECLNQNNLAASTRTSTVSAGCHVASLHVTGKGSSKPFLTDEQHGDFIPPEFQELMNKMGLHLNRGVGADGNPLPIRMMGATYASAGGSVRDLRQQLKLQPDNAELWNNYGAALAAVRQFGDAMAAYQRSIALDASYMVPVANLAKLTWLQRGDVPAAQKLYSTAMELSAPDAPTWLISDVALFYQQGVGDPVRALDFHVRASADLDYPIAQARHGTFLLDAGRDMVEGQRLLSQALEEGPDNAEVLFLAGQAACRHFGDLSLAMARIEKACSISPTEVRYLIALANVALALGDGSSAAYYYRKAISRGAGAWDVESNYGLALLLERKLHGALRHLRRARRRAPGEPVVMVNTAATLWGLKQRTEAIELMRSALQGSPPPEIEVEILAMLYLAESAAPSEIDRLHRLTEQGIRGNAATLRGMSAGGTRAEKDLARELTLAIQGP